MLNCEIEEIPGKELIFDVDDTKKNSQHQRTLESKNFKRWASWFGRRGLKKLIALEDNRPVSPLDAGTVRPYIT